MKSLPTHSITKVHASRGGQWFNGHGHRVVKFVDFQTKEAVSPDFYPISSVYIPYQRQVVMIVECDSCYCIPVQYKKEVGIDASAFFYAACHPHSVRKCKVSRICGRSGTSGEDKCPSHDLPGSIALVFQRCSLPHRGD